MSILQYSALWCAFIHIQLLINVDIFHSSKIESRKFQSMLDHNNRLESPLFISSTIFIDKLRSSHLRQSVYKSEQLCTQTHGFLAKDSYRDINNKNVAPNDLFIPKIAFVGRPNVGKSTLFNRLTNQFRFGAIVADSPGVTRDRRYHTVNHENKAFQVVDTGGLVLDNRKGDEEIEYKDEIRNQTEVAIDEANLLLFIVDSQAGVHPDDEKLAIYLRKLRKPIVLCVNKCDKPGPPDFASDYCKLGFGTPYFVSAIHKTGLTDLLEFCVNTLNITKTYSDNHNLTISKPIRIALIGRPNVGKSSLINALTDSNRCIISPEISTTRDTVDVPTNFNGTQFTLTDTAGLFKKSTLKTMNGVNFFSIHRSLKAIEQADVCLLVIDATQGVMKLEIQLAQAISNAGRACIITCNKWDILEKDLNTLKKTEESLKLLLPPVKWSPILFVSAKNKLRMNNIFQTAQDVYFQFSRRLKTPLINEVIADAINFYNLRSQTLKKSPKIYYSTQVSTSPPTFVSFCNNHNLFNKDMKVYMEETLRKSFGFEGTPIRWFWRSKKDNQMSQIK